MSFDLPPLKALPAFEAAGRHLSFTRAAEELNMTQAGISFQVRNLEQSLGVRLFERYHRSLKLTLEGETLLKAVQGGVANYRQWQARDNQKRRHECREDYRAGFVFIKMARPAHRAPARELSKSAHSDRSRRPYA